MTTVTPLDSKEINSPSYTHQTIIVRLNNISGTRNPNNSDEHHHKEIIVSDMVIKFPRWQRFDKWVGSYEPDLIKSVLSNKDIPKVFIAHYKEDPISYLQDDEQGDSEQEQEQEDGDWVIDGGHRLRAFVRYKNNEFSFPISIDGVVDDVYYNNVPHRRNHSRVLNANEKIQFDNYQLNITHYTNMSETQAREKFNVLNHSRPMTIGEKLNSINRPLVDFLRDQAYQRYSNGDDLIHKFKKMRGRAFSKISEHEFLVTLYTIWSIVNPRGTGEDRANKALEHCKVNEKELQYIMDEYDGVLIQPNEVKRFEDTLESIFHLDQELNCKATKKAFMLSALVHMACNSKTSAEFITMTDTFATNQVEWTSIQSEKNKLINMTGSAENTQILNMYSQRQSVIDPYNLYLRYWKTQKVSGIEKNGMLHRKQIFKELMDHMDNE